MVEKAGNFSKLSLPRSEGKDYSRTSPEHVTKGPVKIVDVQGQGFIVSQELRHSSERPFAEVLIAQPAKVGDEIPQGATFGVVNISKDEPLTVSLQHPEDGNEAPPLPEVVHPLAYNIVPRNDGSPKLDKNNDFKGLVRVVFDRTKPSSPTSLM